VNLTAPVPVTNADLTSALGKALHRPTLLPVPKIGPAALLGRELAHELLYASQRVMPRVLERDGYKFSYPDVESALHDLLAR
jgi:NAD dependent epimerase/dehydratase family enzyme